MNLTTIRLALRELWANKLRTFLTCLGMIIGVGAVIALLTIGAGVTAQITNELKSFGNNLVMVFPGSPRARGPDNAPPFDRDDMKALRDGVPGMKAVTPVSQNTLDITHNGRKVSAEVTGAEPDYFDIALWEVSEGRRFTESELGRTVCVIGKTVRERLFKGDAAIGQKVRIGRLACEVIGVLKEKGRSMFQGDQDKVVIMPLRAFQRRIQGSSAIFFIQASAQSREDITRMMEGIRTALRATRSVNPEKGDNFTVRDLQGFVKEAQGILGYITLFVGAVAAISLIVGGIGIMNIMLVSVTERTREIGIRLAIGAQENNVLMQFLTEAMILAVVGGLAGIGFGLGIALLVSSLTGWPFLPSMFVVAGATLFSAAFGIVFGFFPARRAAKMNPIDALRYE